MKKEKRLGKGTIEENIQQLFKKKGEKPLKIAKNLVQKETKNIESKEVQEALQYFICEYWNDVVTPALISLGCEAVKGDPANTIPVAVPIILISGSVDIHDDIIDKSKTKYNRLTVFGKYGQDIALLVGDALLFKGLTLLQDAAKHFPHDKLSYITEILKNTFFELGDAEASEIRFRGNINVTPKEYLQVMRKKAADVEGLFHIGALIGGGSLQEIGILRYYGRIFGLVTILRDDWIDTLDTKELKHRILFEHLPLPILYVLQDQKAKVEVKRILQKGRKITQRDMEKLLEATEKFRGFEQTKRIMKDMADKAIKKLVHSQLEISNLERLMRFVVNL